MTGREWRHYGQSTHTPPDFRGTRRPPCLDGLARNLSKTAHSSSDIRPRITDNLRDRGQSRITYPRVVGIPRLQVCPHGLVPIAPSAVAIPKSTARNLWYIITVGWATTETQLYCYCATGIQVVFVGERGVGLEELEP